MLDLAAGWQGEPEDVYKYVPCRPAQCFFTLFYMPLPAAG
ncbi:hypothetical protein DLM_2246 [Aquitalea magnusonii]|uniref:Uncharacterized protein n=1 Tax=Aquitalea magnusonii TaxID=332411 RepID=A0A3G9GHX5_9NEIS|nr:hypothetical protein DLM_2246 [Aquitalea magnusonii]